MTNVLSFCTVKASKLTECSFSPASSSMLRITLAFFGCLSTRTVFWYEGVLEAEEAADRATATRETNTLTKRARLPDPMPIVVSTNGSVAPSGKLR